MQTSAYNDNSNIYFVNNKGSWPLYHSFDCQKDLTLISKSTVKEPASELVKNFMQSQNLARHP